MVQYIAPGSGHKKPGASLCSLGYCGQEVVQLLVESAQEFADTVQTHGAACDRGDSDEDLSLRLLVHSRRYLRHMDACAAAARARLGGADPLLKEHLQVLGAALAAACAVWQLAEALLLHDAHGVAWPVVRWLRDRVDADLEPFLLDAERRLQTSSHPELRSRLASAAPQRDEPWFYMLVAHLLLRGDFARAAAALRAHGDCGSDGGSDAHVREVIELIESYPDFPAVSKAAGAEQPMAALQRRFASDFGRFQTECRIVRDGIRTAAAEAKAGGGCGDVDVKDLGELANLCALMGGDLGALKVISQLRWSQHLSCMLLFKETRMTPSEIEREVKATIYTLAAAPTGPRSGGLHNATMAMLGGHVGTALQKFSELGEDLPMAAAHLHLAHLLACAFRLKDSDLPAQGHGQPPLSVKRLLTRLYVDLAQKLAAAVPAGWEVAAQYLSTNGSTYSAGMSRNAEGALRGLVERATLRSERECVSLWTWCQQLELNDVAALLCQTRAAHWRARRRPATAALWLARAGDAARLAAVAAEACHELAAAVAAAIDAGGGGGGDGGVIMQDGSDEWQVVQRACDKATAVADAAEPFGAADATIGALPQLHFLRLYAQLAALLLRADAETPEILAKAMDTLTAALDTGAPTYTRPYLLRAALPLLRASNAAAAAGRSAAACAADVQQCSAILNCLLDLEDSVRSADLDAPAVAAATAAPLPRALREALERELAVAAHWALIADSAARPMIAADAARELKDRPAMTQSALDLMGPMLLF